LSCWRFALMCFCQVSCGNYTSVTADNHINNRDRGNRSRYNDVLSLKTCNPTVRLGAKIT
jgi:5-methylcytosine-specific restriction endonuclease McrA